MIITAFVYKDSDVNALSNKMILKRPLYEYSMMHAEGIAEISSAVSISQGSEKDILNGLSAQDILVILDSACPIRDGNDIKGAINMIKNDPEIDCVVSIKKIGQTDNAWYLKDGSISKAQAVTGQDLYEVSPNFTIFRVGAFISGNVKNTKGYEIKKDYTITNDADFVRVSRLMDICYCEGKEFVFDIDGVIAKINPSLNYADTEPIKETVRIVNDIYDRGNKVILFTARGFKTGIDWREVTEKEMKDWGVKYTELRMGKPSADYYIDDKFLDLSELYLISEIKGIQVNE